MPGTEHVRAMDQTVDQSPRPFQRVYRVPSMVTDMHLAATHGAGAIHDLQLEVNERFRWPSVRHDGRFLASVAESDQATRNSKLRKLQYLARKRAVEK